MNMKEQKTARHEKFINLLKEANSQLQQAKQSISNELINSGEKIDQILKYATKPLYDLGVFPTIDVVARFYGRYAPEVFVVGPTTQSGLLLSQDENFSIFLNTQGQILKTKTHRSLGGKLYAYPEEGVEEVPLDEIHLYALRALEGISSYLREYFLV